MAQPQTRAGQVISETAQAEGGPTKGSTSAQMQSQVGKQQNFEQAAQEVGSKIESAPETVTAEDANYLKSREARATGQQQPPKDSISADAQRLASANEKGVPMSTTSEAATPADQSARDRVENFEKTAEDVAQTMANDPQALSKEQADQMHSREQRAFGATSKGGIASQAQALASENEGKN